MLPFLSAYYVLDTELGTLHISFLKQFCKVGIIIIMPAFTNRKLEQL